MAFHAELSSLTLDGFRVMKRDGRPLSSNADGAHCRACAGTMPAHTHAPPSACGSSGSSARSCPAACWRAPRRPIRCRRRRARGAPRARAGSGAQQQNNETFRLCHAATALLMLYHDSRIDLHIFSHVRTRNYVHGISFN